MGWFFFLSFSALFLFMCGITGVFGTNASEKVFHGLKALEYRGYDSWGIAFPQKDSFFVKKEIGKIGSAKFSLSTSSTLAIGHTRWATHGNVSKKNAHPQFSNDKKIALVHNGIVENFEELKNKLISKGFSFFSDTDSEIIANLIQFNFKKRGSFEEAVRISLKEIEGGYAIVVLHLNENKLFCARNGSPLVLGFGENEFFVASDVSAFVSYTKKVLFLNDSELAVIDGEVKVFSVDSGKEKKFSLKKINWDIEQAKKGEFKHFMTKEIFEQPETLKLAVEQPEKDVSKFVKLIKSSKKVFLVGCGTSYHSCLSAAYFFSSISNVMVECCIASEFSRVEKFVDKNSLVIAVSQSGETADLLEAIKNAKKNNAKVVSIVNVMGSSVMRISDCSLLMNAGPEICVLSTKSYTSQIAVFLLLAYAVIGKQEEAKRIILKTASSVNSLLKTADKKMKVLAKKLAKKNDIFVIGRHDAFPVALEAALKIKEVSYIHAEGFAGGELKHGTIALIDKGTPAIVISTPETRRLIVSNAIEMQSRGAFTIGFSSVENSNFDFNLVVPDVGFADAITRIVPIQLLAYYIAIEKNLDPDKPRNLAKSVTVK